MRVWRVSRRAHAAFDGKGARLAGGRWNHRGTPVVYTSATLSLAALEYFVNLDPGDAPDDLVATSSEVPDGLALRAVREKDLPSRWRGYPAPEALADLGTEWARRRSTAVLAVPSAVVPPETNYLLNPAHPEFRRISVGRPEAFSLDPRTRK